MAIDPYTKIVLTVIAATLVALVAQNAVKSADAQTGQLSKVVICDLEDHCARVLADGRNLSNGSLAVWQSRPQWGLLFMLQNFGIFALMGEFDVNRLRTVDQDRL